MEKELIKLLLNKKFYNKNKSKLSKEFFTNGTSTLYETIKNAHEHSDKDLSINRDASDASDSNYGSHSPIASSYMTIMEISDV